MGLHSRVFAVWIMGLSWGAFACIGEDAMPWQANAAEAARELGLLDPVEVVEMTREEFRARAEDRAGAISDEALRGYAQTYGRLGFFDVNIDLRPIMAGSSSDWVGATYSPRTKQVTLVGEARDDVLVHEFVHALQDQHFDLTAYDDPETSDAYLSRRAVVEGDAVLAQYRFVAEEDGRSLDGLDWPAVFDDWRAYSRDMLVTSEYPPLFLNYVAFVYSRGLEYCAANLTGVTHDVPARAAPHDWSLENDLFLTRPPRTTRQVLALDMDGALEAADPVVDIGLRSVPSGLQNRLELVDWDSLGEWFVYLLLLPLETGGTLGDAASLAAAWDGDTVLFAREVETGVYVTLWASAWEDEQTAAEIAAAMRALYGAPEPAEGFLSTARDGEPVWIEQRGTRLVAAKNVAADLAAELVEAAFAPSGAPAMRLRPSLGAVLERIRVHDPGPANHFTP